MYVTEVSTQRSIHLRVKNSWNFRKDSGEYIHLMDQHFFSVKEKYYYLFKNPCAFQTCF